MELLALVIFNIVFGIFLYFVVSIKVTNSVRDYQITKLKKEIYNHTLTFYKESENYLTLMDSKIKVLKNLIEKAEKITSVMDSEKFEKLASLLNSQRPKEATPNTVKKTQVNQKIESEPSFEEIQRDTGISTKLKELKEYLENRESDKEQSLPEKPEGRLPSVQVPKHIQAPQTSYPDKMKVTIVKKDTEPVAQDMMTNFIAGFGKAFKSIVGLQDLKLPEEDELSETPKLVVTKKDDQKKNVDFSIGGDPFIDLEKPIQVVDNLKQKKESDFQVLLQTNETKGKNDTLRISPALALSELPKDATKIEKVVHLLKKGFSHYDISEELGYSIPEISLIETIHLERNRRV